MYYSQVFAGDSWATHDLLEQTPVSAIHCQHDGSSSFAIVRIHALAYTTRQLEGWEFLHSCCGNPAHCKIDTSSIEWWWFLQWSYTRCFRPEYSNKFMSSYIRRYCGAEQCWTSSLPRVPWPWPMAIFGHPRWPPLSARGWTCFHRPSPKIHAVVFESTWSPSKPHRGHTSPGNARSELERMERAVFLFSSLLLFCVLQLYSESVLKYTKVLNYPAEISPVIAVEFIHTRLYESTKCISATL